MANAPSKPAETEEHKPKAAPLDAPKKDHDKKSDGRTSLSHEATSPGDAAALRTVKKDAGDGADKHLPAAEAHTKAPTLDQKTIDRKAEELHEALTRTKWLGLSNDTDKEKALRILGPLTEADRKALEQTYEQKFGAPHKAAVMKKALSDTSGIDHSSDFKSSTLRATLDDKLGGKDAVDFRRAEALLNSKDGKTNDAGALMVAIKQADDDKARGNVAIRAVFETLNKPQIAELESSFQRDYGKTWQQALSEAGRDITPQTAKALDILKVGVDNKTSEDVIKLAHLAIETRDHRLFGEALRGDSPAALEARQQLLSDKAFLTAAAATFPDGKLGSMGPSMVRNMAAQVDANGNWKDVSGKSHSIIDLMDPVGQDYLREGRISLKTITTADTGKWIFNNQENIALAAKNASDNERAQFTAGQQISQNGGKPANEGERQALDYYNKIHDTFKDRGSTRETAMWEDQLIHGRESVITEMAKTHSEGWSPFAFGEGHSKQDLMSKVDGLSEQDWRLLKDPTKGPQFRKEIESSLRTFADDGERDRIMRMLDEKAAKGTYAESQTVHRGLLDTAQDNKGHDFLWFGTSYDAKNLLSNLSSMSPTDAQNYRTDPEFKKQIDSFVKNDSEFNDTEMLLAQRLLAKAGETGTPPKPDALDTLLKQAVDEAKKPELVEQAQKALAADPALRQRLSQPDSQLSPDDLTIKRLIRNSVEGAFFASNSYDHHIKLRDTTSHFISTGELSLGEKLSLGLDKKTIIADAAAAPPAERAAVIGRFSEDEKKVIEAAAANGGKLTLADRMQMVSIGQGTYQDLKAELEQIRGSKDGFVQMQHIKDDYAKRYGKDFDDTFLKTVDAKDQDIYKRLITPSETDGRQTFYDNVWKALRSDSGATIDGTNMTLQKSIDQTGNSLEEYQRIYQTMPPEKQKALDDYFNMAFEQHKASKEKLAEIAVTAVVTASALALAPFTAGASVAVLASYAAIAAAGGAAVTVGMKMAITGNDYDKEHVMRDIVHGAVSGGLIFALPPAGKVMGLFKSGAEAAVSDAGVVALMGGLQVAERAAIKKGLAEGLMQAGKSFGEKEALVVIAKAAPGLSAEAKQVLAAELKASVARNYGQIERGVEALAKETADAAKLSVTAKLGKEVGESAFISAGGNAVATIADAPFNPKGLDTDSLITQTLVGATVGAIMPLAFKGVVAGKDYVLNVSKEVNPATGATEAIVHVAEGAKPVQIRRADGTIETVTEKAPLRDGDQIVSGPEKPSTAAVKEETLAKPAVSEKTQPVNERGQLVNERNQVINEKGQIIDSKGTPIEQEFPQYARSEFDRVRPEMVTDLKQWRSIEGNNVGEGFETLSKKLGLSEAEKNQILDGLTTVREHGARMKDIDPEQEINWKHTQREFGAAVDYAARNNMTKAETQDMLLSAMFSDGLKTKFNFTTHNVDGATAFEHYAATHLKDMPAERIAGIKQAILEHQVAPPQFMAMIYSGAIMGSIKAEGRAITEAETAALNSLKEKISNPFALKDSQLIDVPGGPVGAKAVNLTAEERALLQRTGLNQWYVPHEGNAWNKASRGLIDADGIDNYAGPGGLSKIIGLRGPGKAAFFQDRHVLYGNPENAAEISSADSWKQSQRDFLGSPENGKLGVASPQTRQYVEQQSQRVQKDIEAAQSRVNQWINSSEGRAELGLPANGAIDKIPGWSGTKEHPDLLDYSKASPEELARARKIWDRFGEQLGREQRVGLIKTPGYTPLMRRAAEGQHINDRGQVVNDRGQLVNERNQVINEKGQVIDSKGTPIEQEFPQYARSEFDRVRPEMVTDLKQWRSIEGNNVGEGFETLSKKLGLSEAEKNQILDGLTTVREHGARMKDIDPEQEINWKHTQREFGAAVDYAARNNMTKAETQDMLLSAMFSDGLKTKFNFTTHNVDGATAFEHYAATHLKDMPAERIAGIKQAILEHQVAPPQFMAMIYSGAIMGSIKAEGRAITEAETAALNSLKEKISNPFALKDSQLIDVPGGPVGAKAVNLTAEERALLQRTGLNQWYVPHEGNAWNKASRGLIDADGIDNYAGPGGLSKIIGLRGPGKAAFFQDRHVLYGNPENAAEISSADSWKQSQRDFLGSPENGKLGVASPQTRQYVEQQSQRVQKDIEAAQSRVNQWINSSEGRAELGLPANGAIDKIPGWSGTKEHPDLLDYSKASPEELARARKIWDRFGEQLGREQRVGLIETPDYNPLMR